MPYERHVKGANVMSEVEVTVLPGDHFIEPHGIGIESMLTSTAFLTPDQAREVIEALNEAITEAESERLMPEPINLTAKSIETPNRWAAFTDDELRTLGFTMAWAGRYEVDHTDARLVQEIQTEQRRRA